MGGTRLSFGERLIAIFKQEGVEAIFSQGDLSMKDIQLHAEAQGLKVVGPRHEASAVFMAMGYHAMTGKVQVAIGAPGPGQGNLLPAAITAAQEHIPVIILGARRQHAVDTAVRRGRWLYASLLPNFREVCKFAAKLEQLSHLDEVVQEAFRQALSGTPGPVTSNMTRSLTREQLIFPIFLPPDDTAQRRNRHQRRPLKMLSRCCGRHGHPYCWPAKGSNVPGPRAPLLNWRIG